MLPFSKRITTSIEDIPHCSWYTFSKECCPLCSPLCRRMLHGGIPQLPQGVPHSFKFQMMTYEKHALALKIWVDTALGFINTTLFKGTLCLPLQNIPYLFMMQGTLSGKCNTVWGQNEISWHSKVLFPLAQVKVIRKSEDCFSTSSSVPTPPRPWSWVRHSTVPLPPCGLVGVW